MNPIRTRPWLLAVLALTQILLVGLAVGPQLSARVTGDTYLMRVEPLDPIDPFRGAYVTLSYPDLRDVPGAHRVDGWDDGSVAGFADEDVAEYFIRLELSGETWVASSFVRDRPDSGPYLRCVSGWRPDCGIDSLFASQREALLMEEQLADGAIAEVRIDSRGNASVVGLRAE